ncbi:aminotransferase class I/II-fold pyridoxal phosphate-dependent enzyme [Streptomyces kanamyceticus]|uniref:alanine transaminase n=1 Tax=Streptomyces kanamyceticus TaxID=1967 RepID=A0A5J6G7E2_STRKN|nr:aminotransferase class I/II-fold pyridoxal phosphate-dependent enzyme [Streptomyces kanamyceticus]QEU89848.1 aminotransferase class I/II-fold pyridoxal phosphate-dependent enzyme [Streptomyces kanamyceticus]
MIKPAARLSDLSYGLRGPLPQLADTLEQQGRPIIRLHLGDPAAHGLPAPPHVLDAVKHALEHSRAYTAAQGLTAAREAIAAYYHRHGLALHPSDIHLGNGVSELVPLALQAFLNPGDEVLLPSPGYPLWAASVQLAGGVPVYYRCDEHNGWQPDRDHLSDQITARTVALVTNTPHNPTGAVWNPATLRTLADIARSRELLLMADEIYAHITYDAQHTVLATLAPDVPCVTFSGLSKICCIPGFRSAWMAVSGPRAATHAYTEAITQLASLRLCPNVPAQHAIPPALEHIHQTQDSLTGPAGPLRERLNTAWETLSHIPALTCTRPQGAFYLFPRISTATASPHDSTLADSLLRDQGVLIAPGSDFHLTSGDHIRLSALADPATINKAMTRIAHHFDTGTATPRSQT